MADGFDRRHALAAGRPLLEDCPGCQATANATHQCAFLTGVFDAFNWNCAAWVRLAETAARAEGSELEVLVNELPDGTLLVWFRRIGIPQRVRRAYAFAPDLQVRPVVLDDCVRALHST